MAFRHSSVAEKIKDGIRDSYERLEFLGDAVIGLIIAEYLFKKYPFKTEGFLTNIRSKIVCGKNLSKISQKLGLGDLLISNISQKSNGYNARLEDILEAVLGAIYLDKGYKYAKKIFVERILNIHIDIKDLIETETNFKSKLLEWAQKNKHTIEYIANAKETSKSKAKQFVVDLIVNGELVSQATHNNIKGAEQLAAEKAINKLIQDNVNFSI